MGYAQEPERAGRKPVISVKFPENTGIPQVYRCFRNLLD